MTINNSKLKTQNDSVEFKIFPVILSEVEESFKRFSDGI